MTAFDAPVAFDDPDTPFDGGETPPPTPPAASVGGSGPANARAHALGRRHRELVALEDEELVLLSAQV